MSIRKFTVAAALLAGALAAGTAHAGPDVQWQLTVETPKIRLPGHIVLPLPPILVPRAVVVESQAAGRVYYPEYGYAAPSYDRSYSPYRDRSPVVVQNRYERDYNPRWDRDGDGIPNRYDAYPDDSRNGHRWHEREYRRDDRRNDRRDDRHEDRRDWRDDRRH